MTDLYAVIGDPIAQSLSPAMHNAAFASAGLDALYEARRVSRADLPSALRLLARSHRGFNVTIPHKETILPCLDEADGVVRALGAANTVRVDEGRLGATNTDPHGFLAALDTAGGGQDARAALVFGAGGSARAVVHALLARGRAVSVHARTPERALPLAALGATVIGERDLPAALAEADLVVNCTPLGMGDLASLSPLPAGAVLDAGALCVDLVYGYETPFLREAARQGARVSDGLEMLVRQGAASFRFWTGIEPDIAGMREACRAAVEERACYVS